MRNLKGPFKIEKMTDKHPLYARLLTSEAEQLEALPDFSKDNSLFIFSDFGGEHKKADFNTYSILICSGDKRDAFEIEAKKIRDKYGLNAPWKEYAFKDLKYGPISRALDDFLEIADKFIYGVLINLSIDRKIESPFAATKKNGT